jgi:predicted RNA-binding Zn ribbon-like protein
MKHASGPAPDPGDVGRLPAPTDLELVRALINSRNSSSTWDKLATAAAAEVWLRERGLIDAKVRLNAAEAAQLRALREALRGLAARSNGRDLPTDVALLQRAAERAKFGLGFDPRTGRSELRPTAGGVAGAVGRILGEVHEAMHDGTWPRLKICAADTCVWAYYDRSKNSHSRWCSPAVCGNRDKVRRYRERERKSVGKRR